MAGEWKFLICTSHRGAGTLKASVSLYWTSLQAQLDVTGTVCLPLGDSKKTNKKNQKQICSWHSLQWHQSGHESIPTEREHPLFVLHTSPSEAVWLTADPVRAPDFEQSVHIPTHKPWRGAHWGRTVVPKRLINKEYKWVTVTSINLRMESWWRVGWEEGTSYFNHIRCTTCRPPTCLRLLLQFFPLQT